MPFSLYHVRRTWELYDITGDVSHHLVKTVFAKFLYRRVTIFPFSHLFFGSVSNLPSWQGKWWWELSSTSWVDGLYLHTLFGILLWALSLLIPFIDLFNHLFISALTHGYLFYRLGYNPILCYLFFCSIFPALAIGSSFRLVLLSFWHANPLWFFWRQFLTCCYYTVF